MNERLLRAARGLEVDRPPVWIMRQAGRYLPEYHQVKGNRDFFACCRDPGIASTLTIQPIKRYHQLDAAIIYSDILVIPQAMGMDVRMREHNDRTGLPGPYFPHPLDEPSELPEKDVDVQKELGYVYDAIRLTKKKIIQLADSGERDEVPLIGFCGAPWTLMAYMIQGSGSKDFQKAKDVLLNHPKDSKHLLSRIAIVAIDHLTAQVQAGANYLQVFDSWAGHLSSEHFKEFSLPFLTQIATGVKDKLKVLAKERKIPTDDVPITVFAKEAKDAFEELVTSGFDVVSLDPSHDPATRARQAAGRVALQGNMDPGLLYEEQDTEKRRQGIIDHVQKMLPGFGKQKYVINLGHGVTPKVTPEDVLLFLEECDRVGKSLKWDDGQNRTKL